MRVFELIEYCWLLAHRGSLLRGRNVAATGALDLGKQSARQIYGGTP